jgi:hypothetical protein
VLTKLFFSIVAAVALLLHHQVLAQESAMPNPENGDRWWINLGVGFGGGAPNANKDTDVSTVAANASVSYQFGANLISLRSAETTNSDGFFLFVTGEFTSAKDIALLYGRSTKSPGSQASIAAGIGFVEITRQDFILFFPISEIKTERATGLALESQLFVQPASFLGLGLYGYANLNSKNSFYGVTLSLRLGKLR